MANEILCVIDRYTSLGGKQVTNYMRKNGERFTEVARDFGYGKKGFREIYPNKVIDKVGGTIEEYRPEKEGVVRITNGVQAYFPNMKFAKIAQID